MRFEEIIKDVRKGKKFTDGSDIYKLSNLSIMRLETELMYDDKRKPYWTHRRSNITLGYLLNANTWEIVENEQKS